MWILGMNMLLLVTFMWKIHSYSFCEARGSNVTNVSSVTNYCNK